MSFVLSLDMSLAALTLVPRVRRVLLVVSNHVLSALATFHTSSVFSGSPLYFVERQDLAMAATLSSNAAPRTIQAVLGCQTKNCSSAS